MRFNLFLFIIAFSLFATNQITAQEPKGDKPRLVVGIVVDQMRYDYITRFWDRYGEGGFKKLVNEGFNLKNNHFNYIPTSTGPGHASVFTGTNPVNHGVIANDWYDKFAGEKVYCAGDDAVNPIGTQSNAGKMSPHRMKSTSVADENRLHTQMRGKTIGIALKDRGSILPAGHTANAAYWFQGKNEGNWITSSFYLKKLPQWVKDFNDSKIAESYIKTWNTLYSVESYTESGADLNEFEGGFNGKEAATFPYDLKALAANNGGFDLLKTVAFGNDLTTRFALAAIEAEELGKDTYTDFLTLSYSSTDYVGHNFGVNSKEVQDTYLRLDQNLETLLNELDNSVGEGNFTVFLTADHGGGDVPSYLKTVKIPSGYFDDVAFRDKIEKFVEEEYKTDNLIHNISNNQIFFNYQAIRDEDINAEQLENSLANYILQLNKIDKVFTRGQLSSVNFTEGIAAGVQKGFNQKRSGDVIYVLDPATVVYSHTGSTHGSGFMYDTHVPLIFYGNGIKKGSTYERSEITDIAPTISALLGIGFPSAATGTPLYTVFSVDQE